MRIFAAVLTVLSLSTFRASAADAPAAPAAAMPAASVPEAAAPAASTDVAAVAAPKSSGMTEDQKTLYALGLALGRNITVFQLKPAELKFVEKGIEDQMKGATPKVDLKTYGPKIDALARERKAKQAAVEKAKAKAFLAKAETEKGAVKTETGLIYLSEADGTGTSPKAEDTVKVSYRGTFTDGKVFDESKEPVTFPLNHVIPCWTEGVQKMKPGGKAKLVCPSSIAYGDQGQGPIPGGATLVFEVQLVGIEKPGADAK
jgi:FKBP-type peptidyl-prolyl cis-trans isomerase FkpA